MDTGSCQSKDAAIGIHRHSRLSRNLDQSEERLSLRNRKHTSGQPRCNLSMHIGCRTAELLELGGGAPDQMSSLP